jgi:tetratricopeptide (TPR) repeat protein
VSDHPTWIELRDFWNGGLAAERVRAVVRHLLEGCEPCGALLSPHLKALFGFPLPEEEMQYEDAYDAVLDRAFAAVAEQVSRPTGRLEWIRETLVTPPLRRPPVAGAADPTAGPAGFEALLERCAAVRYEDPARMVDLARFAASLADRLDPRQYGTKRVANLRCRAWTELANAYRVADRLREALEALNVAADAFAAGTLDEVIGARLLDVQASLDADRRHFAAALESLEVVHAVHLRRGDRHLAGRALLTKGLYAGYGGDPERAVELLEEGLALVDRPRDPGLVFGAVHNLARGLMECGRFEEARELLRSNHAMDPGGRVNRLKVRWLEGQIAAGLGELDRAEQALAEVRLGFEEMDLRYKASLAALELAAVHLRQGRADEARDAALEAVGVFTGLGIGREAMASVLVIRAAFERRSATAALLESVAARLFLLEREPSA